MPLADCYTAGMPFVQGEVAVMEVDQESWVLLEAIVYQGKAQTFTVPVNFSTDFASVPQAFTWLIPRYGIYTKAAILHDYLCREKIVNRADADGIFRRAMRELGVSFLRRWMMWAAVRYDSKLSHAKAVEVLQWLLVTLPAIAFLITPYIIVVVWSALFWLLEVIAYLIMKPFSKRKPNMPNDFGASG